MGHEPPRKPPPAPPGTVTGRVTVDEHGPGADDGRPGFTNTSPIACTVRAGSASARTNADGAYALQLPAGQIEVSFADCAKSCCYDPPSAVTAEVKAGSATHVDWSCSCDQKAQDRAPPPSPPPPPPPPHIKTGTVTGHVVIALRGPGRAHAPEESFTNTSGIACTVRAGSAAAKTRSDGSYTLRLPVGHYDEVSFLDCVKPCCASASTSAAVDVKAGAAARLDWSCDCFAK